MHPSLKALDHRPWPLPSAPWTWRQSWRDLLFAHWPVARDVLLPLVPEELEVQEFEGSSWVGVVPFRMSGVMRRPFPDFPGISAFPELNLRLYVEKDGRPGVWFLSLDAANSLAVWAARKFFHLPYSHAAMGLEEDSAGTISYRSRRQSGNQRFEAEYSATSEPYLAQPDSLEHWLTERYCLYARSPDGRLFRGEIHHPPWPLQKAEAEISHNDLWEGHFPAPTGPPALLHFARRIDVVVWNLEPLT
ncbi:MAG: DUF2071 domain-containing protein [Deltaproteobacteria bacterium]|nr:DUF2071 domain-containing protein [Deltaproteobacteria bacterium]